MSEKIGINRYRLKELFEAERKLKALEMAGVDNWQGYNYAMDILKWEVEDSE